MQQKEPEVVMQSASASVIVSNEHVGTNASSSPNAGLDIVMGDSEEEIRRKLEEKTAVRERERKELKALKVAALAVVNKYQTNTLAQTNVFNARRDMIVVEDVKVTKKREEALRKEFEMLNEAVLFAANKYPANTLAPTSNPNTGADIVVVGLEEERWGNCEVSLLDERMVAPPIKVSLLASKVVVEEKKRRLDEGERETVKGRKKKPKFITEDEGGDMEH
jgi:hypothetical protein